MKLSITTRSLIFFLACSVLFTSCVSTTTIHSVPSGAKLYLNGEPVGTTPFTHRDTRIIGSTTLVKLEKEGFETLNTSFTRDEEVDAGAVIGGFCFFFPFLWAMKYKPTHTFELVPSTGKEVENKIEKTEGEQQKTFTNTKAGRLRELKDLYDEKLITEDEYKKARQKILEEQ